MIDLGALYYFAHPYTSKDPEGNIDPEGEKNNFELSIKRSAELIKRGVMVCCPIIHTHPIHVNDSEFMENKEYELWMKLDRMFFDKTDFKGIILAPGWEKSSGCNKEKQWFEEKGLEVLHYEDIINNLPLVYGILNQTNH